MAFCLNSLVLATMVIGMTCLIVSFDFLTVSIPSFLFLFCSQVLFHHLYERSSIANQIARFRRRFKQLSNCTLDGNGGLLGQSTRWKVSHVGKGGHPRYPAQALNLRPNTVQLRQHDQHGKRLRCPLCHRISDCIVIHKKKHPATLEQFFVVYEQDKNRQEL